jgi:hypothetical protein
MDGSFQNRHAATLDESLCRGCAHHEITWDRHHPYGCRGTRCLVYERRER